MRNTDRSSLPGSWSRKCVTAVKAVFDRLKFWLRYSRIRHIDTDCRSCCLFCRYFDCCSQTRYAEWAMLPWKM